MNKKICILLTMIILTFTLTGCAKCISTETSTVQVKVTDKYYMPSYTTFAYNAATKTMMPIMHSAVYRISVEYNGFDYSFSGRETYKKYSDKVGEYVNGTLRTKKYDNGTVRCEIISLE